MRQRLGMGAALALAVCAMVCVPGCATRLAPGGAYTDPYIFRADQTAKAAYDSITVCLGWEKANRATLPDAVRSAAKEIRETAPRAFVSYAAVSRAYKTAPAQVGTVAVDKALAVLTASLTESAKWLSNTN